MLYDYGSIAYDVQLQQMPHLDMAEELTEMADGCVGQLAVAVYQLDCSNPVGVLVEAAGQHCHLSCMHAPKVRSSSSHH